MKKSLSILIILFFILVPIAIYAAVGLPFGGTVILTKPCDEGLLLTVKTPKKTGYYMWFWGNLRYSSYIPPHSKQKILGIAEPIPVPCTVSGYPYSGGLPIIFHGSSK